MRSIKRATPVAVVILTIFFTSQLRSQPLPAGEYQAKTSAAASHLDNSSDTDLVRIDAQKLRNGMLGAGFARGQKYLKHANVRFFAKANSLYTFTAESAKQFKVFP